jgi:hypothetical protein
MDKEKEEEGKVEGKTTEEAPEEQDPKDGEEPGEGEEPDKPQPKATEEEEAFEFEWEDGRKRTLTRDEVAESIDAADRLKELQIKHKKLLDEASRLKNDLKSQGRPAGNGKKEEEPSTEEDLTITMDDLNDGEALAGKFNKAIKTIKSLQKKLEEANDPKKRSEEIAGETFRQQVEREVTSDPLLKKMSAEGGMNWAREAIAWAVQQNAEAGSEVYDTPRKAIDGYKEYLGIVVSQGDKSVNRRIRKITTMLKTPGETVSGGASSTGNMAQKYLKLSPAERIKFESKLSPEESKKLSLEMATSEDTG